LFEVLVGEKEHPAAFADAARLERRSDVGDGPIEVAEADRRVLVEIDERELVGIALAVCGEEIGDRPIRYLRPMLAEHVTHGAPLAVHSLARACPQVRGITRPASAAAPSRRASGACRSARLRAESPDKAALRQSSSGAPWRPRARPQRIRRAPNPRSRCRRGWRPD